MGNILLIAAIAWFVHKNLIPAAEVVSVATQSLPTPEVVIKSEPMVTPVPHEVVVVPSPPPPAPVPESVSNPLQSDRTAAQANTTSIAEWVESQTLKAEPLPVRPVIKNKAENEAVKPAIKVNVSATSKPLASLMPVIKKGIKVGAELPDRVPVKNDIPFLSELPYDVRRSVPKLTINVFVYSDDPQESFVMIDMVKVKTGQTIQEGMVLKEIRPDSLVVDYQGRTFQIARS